MIQLRHVMLLVAKTVARTVVVLFALSVPIGDAVAQLPVIRLHSLFPPGAKAGSETEVSITGTDLDELSELRFSNPAISAKRKVDAQGKPIANQFVVSVPESLETGTYSVRAIGLFGISNARFFDVSDLPEMVSPGGNHSLETATEIQVNTIVNGHCDARAEDHFKFSVKKDQRLIINCRALRIDSMLDATLALHDQEGRRLAYSRDANRVDPLIDFTATEDATCVVKIHDFTYGGGGNHFYRLSVSDRPYIDYIFPPVAQSGTNASVTLYGRNLPKVDATDTSVDGRSLERYSVKLDVSANSVETISLPPDDYVLPRESFLDAFRYRVDSSRGLSNGKLIYFGDAPVITEIEPNDKTDESQTVAIPCEFAGRFDSTGDRDLLRFSAKKDETISIQVYCDRIGVSSDPTLLIQTIDDKGNVSDLAFVEDDKANSGIFAYPINSHDPAYRFKSPADSQYQLVVRDHYSESRVDRQSVYRLTIRRATPDFRLLVTSVGEQHPTNANLILINTPLLRKNDMQILRVIALRRDGFNEPIKLTVEGLPDKVTAEPAIMPAGKNNADILLLSNDKVTDWSGAVKVIGTSSIATESIQRIARPATVTWDCPDKNNFPIYSRLAHDFSLAVTSRESAPVTIELGGERTSESAHDGKLEFPVKLKQVGTIKGDVQLAIVDLPGTHAPLKFEANDKWSDKSLTIDIAKAKVPPGQHTFYLSGTAKVSYRANVAAAELTAAAVVEVKEEIKKLEQAVKTNEDGATAKLESAKAKLAPAEALAKQAADRANPRDIDIRIRSLPITLTVSAPPAKQQ